MKGGLAYFSENDINKEETSAVCATRQLTYFKFSPAETLPLDFTASAGVPTLPSLIFYLTLNQNFPLHTYALFD